MKHFVLPTLLMSVASALLTGCGRPSSATTSASTTEVTHDAMRVTPITPTRKTLVRTTEQPGQIEAFEETPIHSKIAGFVKKVHVDIDDRVVGPKPATGDQPGQPGQVLAVLDVPELDAELKQKQAAVGQAAAEVTQSAAAVKVSRSAQESAAALLAEAQASVERVDAMFDRWKSEFERIKDLAAKQAVTPKVADETEQQFKAADAARREAAARIKSAQAKLREADAAIEKADADLAAVRSKQKVAEAEEQRTRAMLGYATLRAPFDGIVTVREIDTGHLVQASTNSGGQPLFVVVQADSVRILIDVPEADARLVQAGSPARVRVPSNAAEAFEGKVARTSWTLQAASRTLRTEIDVPNPDGRLRPGSYAIAEVEVARRPDALTLPKSAILKQGNDSFCLGIDGNKIVKRPIKTGIVAGTDVEILSGLSGDELLIGGNVSAYKEGQTVEVITAK